MRMKIKKFTELSTREWWVITRLRVQSFIVERFRPVQDFDSLDQKAYHVLLIQDNQIIGYCRVSMQAPSLIIMDHLLIERDYRDQGLGLTFGRMVIKASQNLAPGWVIQVQPYDYLEPFFQKLGFQRVQGRRPLLMQYR